MPKYKTPGWIGNMEVLPTEAAELLAKAVTEYPIGTEYRAVSRPSADYDEFCTVEDTLEIFALPITREYFITDGCGGCVYSRGEWAEKTKIS